MEILEILRYLVKSGGSDLHLKAGLSPVVRVKGDLMDSNFQPLSAGELKEMVYAILSPTQIQKLEAERELDFSYNIEGLARFRGNLFFQKGMLGAVFRVIPTKIASLDELQMPVILKELIKNKQGLILVTGPTGSGKSTTLAALINEINQTESAHIITIEDPMEFVHQDNVSIINQREIGFDTLSFSEALRHALRQDPDVILVGEMRDQETINIAMKAAETGHLVLSTLHTNDAKQSIDRIINTFPQEEQLQIRMQLALVLTAVISQRLVKKADGSGRIAVQEIMINSPTIRKLIEEGKVGAIDKAIEDSARYYNMQSLNQALFEFWKNKVITQEDALAISNNPNDLRVRMQAESFSASR
jgi:twitching motility protein PilT